jgi:parallel beta-helix repeat protein
VAAIVQAGANQPLSFTVGDDVSLRLTVTENAVAYDWTGATVTTSIIANGAAVATNFTTATSTGGILDLSLTDTQTTTLGLGTFDYWVKVTKGSVTSTWVAGQLTMHAAQYGSTSNLSSTLAITTAASTTLAITLSGSGAFITSTITALPAATAVTADDLFVVVDSPGGTPVSQKATAAQLASFVVASDAELAAIAGLTSAADKGIKFTGSGTAATYDLTAAGLALLDDADASAQRTTLGLGTTVTGNATVYLAPPSGGDDRAAIAAAITAAGVGGQVIYADGTYLVDGATLVPLNNQTHQGRHRQGTTIKVGSGTITGAVMFTLASVTGVSFRWLTFDGNANATMLRGISCTGNGTKKNLLVEECRFKDWRGASTSVGVYVWTAEDVQIINSRFDDCRVGIFADQAQGELWIYGNRIRNTVSASGVYGIQVSSATVVSSGCTVANNYVTGMNLDPSANGSGCHGIYIYKTKNVRISDNTVDTCSCSTSGGGILVGGGAVGAAVSGNVVSACATGIYIEIDATDVDVTVGTAADPRGVSVVGNTVFGIVTVGAGLFGSGISVSYAAATDVVSNVVSTCQGDGIVVDSDRCTIASNIVYNTWTTKSAPAQMGGTKAGIRVYGSKCTVANNQSFDNQTVKTQSYGIAVTDASHSLSGNQCSGNATGDIYQDTSGVTNTSMQAQGFRVTFSNAAYTITAATQVFVAQIGTLSASRAVVLPAASAFRVGDVLTVLDQSGTCTGVNTIVITRAGADTIDGATTSTIVVANGWRRLISDGTSKWSSVG